MSRRTLILIIAVLILLSLCCSCVTGLSLRPPAIFSGASLSAPTLQDVRNRLTTQVGAREIELAAGANQDCRIANGRLQVPEGVECRFSIPASDRQTRQLSLTLEASGASTFLLLEQEQAISVDHTLQRGEQPYALDIYRNANQAAARLTISDCVTEKPAVGEGTPVPKGTCSLRIGR